MKAQILYHGNCFDGVTSAAIFTRFLRQRGHGDAELCYRGMLHGKADPYGPNHDATFHAELNVVVDFRYSPSSRLSWWCDHHQSTFLEPAHEAHFKQLADPQRCFDPAAPSCAGLLARWLGRDHGFDAGEVSDHVRWADLIDSAAFASPTQAVELNEPALQLMMLLESAPPQGLLDEMLQGLSHTSIEQVHALPAIQRAISPVLERHRQTIEHFRRRLQLQQGVAFVDLSADEVSGFNKFIPYYLEPGVRYTVVLTHSPTRAKVSVGSNPWQRPDPLHNIADLCARYGGGGHPVVGAVTLPPQEIEQARRAAHEIATTLRTPAPAAGHD